MYRCADCGEIFDEPEYVQECIGEFWGMPAFETWCRCPYCDSDAVDEYYEDEDEDDDEEIDEEAEYDRWEAER